MAAEVGLAAFSSIVSEVAKSFFAPIIRQTSYMFKYQSFVQDIKNQAEELGHKRQRVEEDIKQAERQGDKIYEDVQEWLKREEQFTGSVVKPIIEDESDAKKNCFKGVCPNLFKRYSLGRKAAKAKKVGDDLLGKGNFSNVSYRPAPETSLMPVRGYEQFDSRRSIFQDVIEALKDPNVDMIGVYGMGGVGKTTLVKQVAGQVKENKLFDEVAMAEVTQTPDHKLIQDKIACDLGLQFEQGESVFQRANRLRERLKTEKCVLLILDNIWTGLELDDIGIPYGEDWRRCTIILTSRSRHLLCNDMNTQKNFFIEVLSKEEARQLFDKIVGHSAKQSDFQPIADEIVAKCGGLPVAVSTIANALKNRSLHTWKDALGQLSNSNLREIRGMDANVYSSIELSYNFLESDEAKYLFLLCSLFRQSESINVSYLLRYGMGWGLFKGVDTFETGWNRVHKLIDDLKAACLLLDGDADYEVEPNAEKWVKLHDVIYDVAVSIAAEKLMFNIPNAVDLKKERVKILQKGATAISLPYSNIQELPEWLGGCPKLELFLLLKKRYSSYFELLYGSMQIPNLFFEGMQELKVLHFTETCFRSLPSSFGCLINLQTLCLDGCQLKDIAIIGQLKDLEILSFRDYDIEQLPVEIGQLTHLRLLDLSNCRRLKVIARNVISSLSQLEELYMGNSFTQWEKIEGGSNNASVAELKELSKLTTLDICIEDAEVVQQDLCFENLVRYRILIGVDWRWHINETSRLMKLRGLEKSMLLGHGMKMLLKITEDLYLKELKGFHNVIHEFEDGEGFPQLKYFLVKNCNEILHIVSSVGQFPLLESLSLYNLMNLEKVCHSQLAEDQSFINLTKVIVKRCHRLKYMFSYTMINSLVQLQHLEIKECNSMEGVVDTTGLGRDDEKVVFPKLHYMELSHLSKLTSFAIAMGIHSSEDNIYTGIQPQPFFDEKVQLPNLEILKISSTENLREIWHQQQDADSFGKLKKLEIFHCDGLTNIFPPVVRLPNLKELSIDYCNKLKNLFPSNMIMGRRFERLEKLIIRQCVSIEEIIEETSSNYKDSMIEVGEVRNDHIVFSQLKHLDLFYLPSLQSFCLGNYTLEFPSLEDVEIGLCPNMKTFSPAVLCTPKLNKVRMFLDSWEWEGNLNSTVQKIFKEMSGFRDIKVLKLSKFPHLKEIWHSQALPVSFFSKLNHLVVDDCMFFSSAIPANLTPFLNYLYSLEVRDCDSVEDVFHLEDLNADEHFGPMLPRLKVLELYRLPRLLHLWRANSQPINLGTLEISKCNKLEKLVLSSGSYEQLTILKVSKCDGLINFVTISTVKSLVSLKRMILTDCKMLEEILEHGGEEVEGCIVFCSLRYLQLNCLPSLTGFCLGNYNLEFPSLKKVVLRECPKMKTFSNGVLSTPKLRKMQVIEKDEEIDDDDGYEYMFEDEDKGDEDEGRWEGNLNSMIQQLFKEMNAQSSIQE